MRRMLWRLRLFAAMPMVILGLLLEDFGVWLQNMSHRVEGEEPTRADLTTVPTTANVSVDRS